MIVDKAQGERQRKFLRGEFFSNVALSIGA